MRYSQIKRLLDLFFALALVLILSPILLGVAVVLILTQGKPVFFLQKRAGLGGSFFSVLKFRTMQIRSDGAVQEDSERLTKLGGFLRRFSIDEIPQLFNIVRGDMSFVGPRPLLAEYLPLYSENERRRHQVRPGITGLAQINGRNEVEWRQRFIFDVEYVDRCSFLMDCAILAKTLWLVPKGEGTRMAEKFVAPFR